MIDDGHAVHYTAVAEGTPVYSADEQQVGKVVQVVDNYKEHIFDGLVVELPGGERRFVDAPEVARTASLGVTLTIGADEVAALPPPEKGAPEFEANPKAGRIRRRLGGGWKRR